MPIRIQVPYTQFYAPRRILLTPDEFEACRSLSLPASNSHLHSIEKKIWRAFWNENRWMYYYTNISLWGIIIIGIFLLNFVGELNFTFWPTDLPAEVYCVALFAWLAFVLIKVISSTTNLTVRSYSQMVNDTIQKYRHQMELARKSTSYEEYRKKAEPDATAQRL